MLSFTIKDRKYWPNEVVAIAPSTLHRPAIIKVWERGMERKVDFVSLLNDSTAIMFWIEKMNRSSATSSLSLMTRTTFSADP